MGGYHVTGRQSSGGNKYIALESYLRVPNNVVSDSRTTTYPEFIYSLWRGSYGLDVGIGYGFPGSEGKWKLFAWGKTAVVGQWQEAPTSVYLNEGETVSISVAINKLARGYVKAEVRRGAQVIHSYDFHITNEAYDQMIQGCTFTRECLLASNGVASQYVNCGAQFRFAKWYWGTLYDRAGSSYPFVGQVLPAKDDGGLFDRKKVCAYCIDEKYGSQNYGCECGTASFTSSLSSLTGDFTCETY